LYCVAFLNGKIRVGLTRAEIEKVAKSHQHAVKISRRDIANLLANRHNLDLVGGNVILGLFIRLETFYSSLNEELLMVINV